MPRRARVVVPGAAHHLTQRGNNRQEIFSTHTDYEVYLLRLFEHAARYKAKIHAYCLMPNHVHLIATPERPDSLAKLIRVLHSDHARYVNVRRGAVGHLWQERFYSCAMDDSHVLRAIAYVERNPLRAGLVHHSADHRWSTARAHLTGEHSYGPIEWAPWSTWYTPERWAGVLDVGLDEAAWRERLQSSVRSGLPIGAPEWVSEIERECGRNLSTRRRGRPKRPIALSAPSGTQ